MSAQVELGWNNTELVAGAKRAESLVKHSAAQMQGAFKGLQSIDLGRLAGLGLAGYGFSQLASGIAQATLRADDNKQSMLAVEGSIEGATRRLREMAAVARSPGLGLDQVAAADVKLRSVGLSAALSEKSIREVGNALALVGRGKADLDGVFLAFTQIVSKGKVSAEEINQIAERVPQIRKIMQEAFGTADTEAIQKLGLSSEEFIRKTLDGFSKLPRAVGGLRNSWENLTDTLTQSANAIGEQVVPAAIAAFGDLEKSIAGNRDTLKDVGVNVVSFGRIVGGVFSTVKSAADLVGEGWAGIINKGLKLAGVTDGTTKSFNDQVASARRLANEQALVARSAADLARKQTELEIATQRVADADRQAAVAAERLAKANIEAIGSAAKRQIDLQEQLRSESEKTRDLTLSDNDRLADAKKKLLDLDRQLNAVVGQKNGDELALKLNIERERTMQRIVQLQQRLGEEQRRANEDAAKAGDQARNARQSAIRSAVDRASAAVSKNADAPGSATSSEETRRRIQGFFAPVNPAFGLAGRGGPLAPDRGPLSKGGSLTEGGGLDAFKKSQNQPGQFDRLQLQRSQFQRLQDTRGKAGDPLFNPAAASKTPDVGGTQQAQQTDILRRMFILWQENLS